MDGVTSRTAGVFRARGIGVICISFALSTLTLAAGAQRDEGRVMMMQELLSGRPFPLKRRAADLKGAWKKLYIGGVSGPNAQPPSARSEEIALVCYTQGETVTVGTQTFLITYRVTSAQPGASGAGPSGAASDTTARKLSADTQLELTLLNLTAIHTLGHIEAFDLAKDGVPVADTGTDRDKARSTASLNNARQIASAILMYARDYDESYPISADDYKQAIYPYIKSDAVFTSPLDENGAVSYTFNRRLEGRMVSAIAQPTKTILLYEGRDEQPRYRYAGKAVIAFADGRVKLCSPDQVETYDWGASLPAHRTPRSRAAAPGISAAPGGSTSRGAYTPPDSALRRLRIVRTRGAPAAVGTLHNVSSSRWTGIRVSIAVLNRAGARLATLTASQTSLNPGADWRFRIPIRQKTAASVEVDDVTVNRRAARTSARRTP